MSTEGPSSPERIKRKPISMNGSPVPTYEAAEEQKENIVQRKPLPEIPIPTSGRIHGAPMSPVKINVQSEAWTPQASTAEIETVKGTTKQPEENGHIPQQEEPQSEAGPEVPVHSVPYRPPPPPAIETEIVPKPQPVLVSPSNPSPLRSDFIRYYGGQSRKTSSSSMSDMQIPEEEEVPPVEGFHYHHQYHRSDDQALRHEREVSGGSRHFNGSPVTDPDVAGGINRHLTPNSFYGRGSVLPRPASAYSDSRGRSPGYIPQEQGWAGRAPSAHSGRSHDSRPNSYIDLLNVPYPQPPPVPITSLDNSQLRTAVGANASLLSTQKTLEMYRQNVKKTNDPSIQYAFAIFLIAAAQEVPLPTETKSSPRKKSPKPTDSSQPYVENAASSSPQDLVREARQILARLADRGYPFAQYYLADGYASGLFNKGKEDYERAFPLFIAASKHGHAESGYRAALCYEYGWGCRKDVAKAVQFYRQSASKNHPGAMTRLGRACLSGDLGLNRYREGLKWLKRATESADPQYNAAPYHLGLLYETGYGEDIFKDETYAAQLFTQAADLGHVEASYRLGDAYEHGKLGCPRDPALSVHFYTGAAEKGHPAAMMALCAWYMVGAEPVLEKDENEAYEWARRAAECGLTKAEYAVGYFTEMGIGCRRDPLEANMWYVRAAEAGDERAKHRLAAIRAAASGGNPLEVADPKSGKMKKSPSGKVSMNSDGTDKGECKIM